MKRLISIGLSAALALSVTGSALAGQAAPPTSDSISITATFTLTGVPATVTYPETPTPSVTTTVSPGIWPNGPIVFGSSDGNGVLQVSAATALNRTPAPGSIAATARSFGVSGTPTGCTTTLANFGSPGPATPWAGTPLTLCTQTAAGTNGSWVGGSKLTIPAGLPSGTYSGTITIAVN